MEQCTEQQGVWNVPSRSLFVSTFSPFSHPFPPLPLSLSISSLFSRCEARYYFYVPLHWQPWLRIDLKKTRVTEPRLARTTKFYVTGVRATGNSVNSKSAGRQRRLAVTTTHRVSLFVPWFCAFTEPERYWWKASFVVTRRRTAERAFD